LTFRNKNDLELVVKKHKNQKPQISHHILLCKSFYL